jgi:hypothetical protein
MNEPHHIATERLRQQRQGDQHDAGIAIGRVEAASNTWQRLIASDSCSDTLRR